MLGYLVLLFMVPFIDIYILVELAGAIGLLDTMAVILGTGLLGVYLIKREGRHVLRKLKYSVTGQEMSRNALEGVMLVVSGLMLITPGLITDLAGFSLVYRPVRERLTARIMNSSDENFRVEIARF